jgi:hypothetical protein
LQVGLSPLRANADTISLASRNVPAADTADLVVQTHAMSFKVWAATVKPEGKEALLVLPPGIVRDQALAHAEAIRDALRTVAGGAGDPARREAMTDIAEGLRRFVKIGPAEPFRGGGDRLAVRVGAGFRGFDSAAGAAGQPAVA